MPIVKPGRDNMKDFFKEVIEETVEFWTLLGYMILILSAIFVTAVVSVFLIMWFCYVGESMFDYVNQNMYDGRFTR